MWNCTISLDGDMWELITRARNRALEYFQSILRNGKVYFYNYAYAPGGRGGEPFLYGFPRKSAC